MKAEFDKIVASYGEFSDAVLQFARTATYEEREKLMAFSIIVDTMYDLGVQIFDAQSVIKKYSGDER